MDTDDLYASPHSEQAHLGQEVSNGMKDSKKKFKMVDFSYEVINQIKDATDGCQVKSIIEKSLDTLAVKNGIFSSKRKYMMNMEMALRYVKAEGLNAKASTNVNHAIEVFEGLRKKDYSNLF